MISIDLGVIEYYDDSVNQFSYDKGGTVRFEYSLKVLYEWEGKWRKSFLKNEHSGEELLDFYMMMALDPIDPKFITTEVATKLADYIKDTSTATTFSTPQDGQNGNISTKSAKAHTAEEIYALMFSSGVSLDFENRNLNRLLIILRIIGVNNSPPKKMSKQDILKQNATLNAQRKAQLKTRG